MASRDEQTDAGRMGASPQRNTNMPGTILDSDAPTLEDEKRNGGWNPNQKPVGDGEPIPYTWPPEHS